MRYYFAVMAALREKMLGMRLLEISTADFAAGNLSSNREHRYPASIAVVEAVDQMQVARSAAPGAG